MISLKQHRTGLLNLPVTLNALERLDELIEHYSRALPGPMYITVNHYGSGGCDIQMNRDIMVPALREQRAKLVEYLAKMGIDANAE